MTSRLLLSIAAICAAWATWLALGFGIDLQLAGLKLTSNDPSRPALLAALAFLAYTFFFGGAALEQRWARMLDRIGDGRLAFLVAAGTMVIGVAYSATAGIASDGQGYVSEADLWLRRNLFIAQPWIGQAPWPQAEWTFAPLGYRPVMWHGEWAIVPVYSAGLSMLMAIAKLIGGQELLYWVVPASGGLLTWLTYRIGARMGSSRAGLIASWLVATSPAMLFMLMQPMSDVPVAAAWTMAIYGAMGRTTGSAARSGLASAIAMLIRPNLVGIAGVLGAWWLCRPDEAGGWGSWRGRVKAPLVYGLCAAPGVLITAAIYQSLYGSPFTSGYGDLSVFFSRTHVLPNIRQYLAWFVESQGWIAVAGIVALLLPIRLVWPWVRERAVFALVLGCLLVLVAQYMAYLVFDGWMYLRFLLAAWPFVMLGVAAVALAAFRARRPVVSLLASAVILGLGVQGIQHARTTHVFRQWHGHRRSIEFAHVLKRETPATSVFYTLNHSGTLRYYAGLTTIRTDLLSEAWLDRSVEWLRSRGLPAYLILEDVEVEPFKERFRGQSLVATLDERLTLVYTTANPYRVYSLTATTPVTPRFIEVGDLRTLRSEPPDPRAFAPQLDPAPGR